MSDEVCLSMDWFSTLVALGHVDFDSAPKLDGINLEPALTGTGPLPERTVFWQTGKSAAARRGTLKWIAPTNNADAPGQLYDLQKDRGETTDVSDLHPEQKTELQEAYKNWRNEVWDGVAPVAR
ncbi:MAG: hypothetical protein R3F19_15650 [Verrucomicrobiales bacterium]